ncbi:Methyltransf_11 domain-containing protein [Gammaproteobacteria bacterium]
MTVNVDTVHAQLRQWYRQVPGRWVSRAERDQLDAFLPSLKGKRIAQIGCLSASSLLASSQIPHRIILDPAVHALDVGPDIHAHADALPFDAETINVLVLPHTLEFASDPHGVLREVNRVLSPEGYVVIIGFNPWGLWGLWRLFRKHGGEVPWCGYFFGVSQIHAWLRSLDFQIARSHYFFFLPPSRHETLMRILSFLHVPGSQWFPISGLYLVVAQKRIAGLTPIRLRWEEIRSPLPDLCWVEPSAPEANHGP